jgi:hypothetical protein
VYLINAAYVSTRDTNVFVSSIGVGVQTTGTATAILRTSAISGGTSDIKQQGGTIQLGTGTDLINKNAGGYPFTTFATPVSVYSAIKGNMFTTSTVPKGWIWPGSVAAAKSTGGNDQYPDVNPAYYAVPQSTIVYGVTANLTGAPGSPYSTIAYLFKNNAVTPFVIGYGATESSFKTFYNSTLTLGPTDTFSVYISSVGGNNNPSHDLSFQVDLY